MRNHTFQYGRHGLIVIQTSFPRIFILAVFSFEGWSASDHESKASSSQKQGSQLKYPNCIKSITYYRDTGMNQA